MPSRSDVGARYVPRLLLVVCAVLFSTGGAAIKACELSGLQVAGLRSGIAALTIALLVPSTRRGWSLRILPVGIVYAATLIVFVAANKRTTAANAVFLQSTAPLYVLLLGPWLLRERIRKFDLAFIGALAAGTWLLLAERPPEAASAPDPRSGNQLALMGGVLWALTLIGLRRLGASGRGAGGPLQAVVVGNTIAFVACMPWMFPLHGTTSDWLVLAYLGVVQIGLAYVLLGNAMPRVPAFEVSVLLMLEPALSPVWAWSLFGERPGLLALLGGALIVLAGLGKTASELRSRAPTGC